MAYKELTVIFKNNPDAEEEFDSGTYSVTYKDASIKFTSQQAIIKINKMDEEDNPVVEGHVFSLRTIKSFKGVKHGSNPKN